MQRELVGRYQGTVVNPAHPIGTRKIQVSVPDVLGGCTVWAECNHTGLYITPERGHGVWVEFQNGDIDQAVWTGEFFGSAEQNELDPVDRLQPDKVILVTTPGGQKIRLSDRLGDESITLEVNNGAKIVLTERSITLEVGAAKIELLSAGTVDVNSGALKVLP